MPDQLWYGRRAEALGTAIGLPWRRRNKVGQAVDRLLTDPNLAAAAGRYRDIVINDDGLARTCDALETLL